MLSDRQLIDADKAYLRRQYPATSTELAAASLVSLRELSATFFDADPSEVTLTSGSFEGGSGSGTLTSKRDIRRIALEELIAERDPDYVAPVAAPGPSRYVNPDYRWAQAV